MQTKAFALFGMMVGWRRSRRRHSLGPIVAPAIEKRIFVVREHQVMLDEDLADLYGVETRRLIEQVRRNRGRFPEDFMLHLTKEEAAVLRSQIAISNGGSGGRRYAPYVFTEQGIAMLSGVLRSDRAVAVNIEIMRAFVGSNAVRLGRMTQTKAFGLFGRPFVISQIWRNRPGAPASR